MTNINLSLPINYGPTGMPLSMYVEGRVETSETDKSNPVRVNKTEPFDVLVRNKEDEPIPVKAERLDVLVVNTDSDTVPVRMKEVDVIVKNTVDTKIVNSDEDRVKIEGPIWGYADKPGVRVENSMIQLEEISFPKPLFVLAAEHDLEHKPKTFDAHITNKVDTLPDLSSLPYTENGKAINVAVNNTVPVQVPSKIDVRLSDVSPDCPFVPTSLEALGSVFSQTGVPVELKSSDESLKLNVHVDSVNPANTSNVNIQNSDVSLVPINTKLTGSTAIFQWPAGTQLSTINDINIYDAQTMPMQLMGVDSVQYIGDPAARAPMFCSAVQMQSGRPVALTHEYR